MTTSRRGGAGRACQLPNRLSRATACAAAASLAQRSSGLCASCLRTNSSDFNLHPMQRYRQPRQSRRPASLPDVCTEG